jgi:hypothetical protein
MAYPVMPLGFFAGSQAGDNDTYQISRSLRFNSSDSAYLNRTPASAGNRKTWTWSGWVKRSGLGTNQGIFTTNGSTDTTLFSMRFSSSDTLVIAKWSTQYLITTQLFRDTSSWFHLVVAFDTTLSTSSDRIKVYINGSQVTAFSTTNYPSSSDDTGVNDTRAHQIGSEWNVTDFLSSYLSEIYLIDGQALTPSSFGETDAITGRWKARAYSGTYGTNGFYLKFADNSGTTSTTLGKDSSPNGNNWTPNNFAVGGAQPALYSSPNLYTNASDVITNGTPLSSGSTFSSVYVYLVTNGGGDVGSTVFTADGSGNIGTAWTWLHRIGGAWTSAGGYNNSEWDSFTWGSQAVATNYIMNNSAPLHMLVPSAGSPQQVSGTIATFNIRPRSGINDDSLVDSPTNYGTDSGLGGEVRGNYCTFNPLKRSSTYANLSNGNLTIIGTTGGAGQQSVQGSIAVSSGKWYAEAIITTVGAESSAGIARATQDTGGYVGSSAFSYGYYLNGQKYNNATGSAYGASYTSGDVIGIAFDADAGTLVFYKNGTSQGTAFTGLTSGPYVFEGSGRSATSGNQNDWNFGQRPFAYTAPTGFKALCTTNLSTPTIKKPNTAMDVVTYTGTGATQTISSLGFSPDLLWTKGRSLAQSHNLFDTLRSGQRLRSDTTDADASTTVTLGSNGFVLGTESENNNSGSTFVAWAWDAGSSSVTNTSGTISSTVRANPQNGVSIVGYTGNGTAGATVGHGLGTLPSMIITKKRSTATSSQWTVGFSVLGWNRYVLLNSTASAATDSNVWNSAPTSSVFYLGNDIWNNQSGQTSIAYCFSEIEGFSKFGSYTGNGSTDGTFVYCGFRPRFVLTKNASTGGAGYNWMIFDSARNTFNITNSVLSPDLSNSEYTTDIDILSNGFKMRNSGATANANGSTMIFAAFAEQPFKYARAR